MKLSLKSTYGILAALDLAEHNGGVPVQAKSIAKRQAIPVKFLEQILGGLKKAGLVESRRGAQGGYVLSTRPHQVSLASIVEALEGPVPIQSRAKTFEKTNGNHANTLCVLAEVVERVKEAEQHILKDCTLKELIERRRTLDQELNPMYHI